MTKVISIQKKKINGELKCYAEALKSIDRMLDQQNRSQQFLQDNSHQSKNQWQVRWQNWREKWKK